MPRYLYAGMLLGLAASGASGQDPRPAAKAVAGPPEVALLKALRANPSTASSTFTASRRGARIALGGTVGTKQIHDDALRVASAAGAAIRDDLVIDTNEVYRTLPAATAAGAASTAPGTPPYLYPPPLFGYVDDPFYGFVPPDISYPPYWPELTARRVDPRGNTPPPTPRPQAAAPTGGSVDVEIDPLGVAVVTGSVPTRADAIAVGQYLAQQPGIVEVRNRLTISGALAKPAADPDEPPPRPEPPGAAIRPDRDTLRGKVAEAITKRPTLANMNIKTSVVGDVAMLDGKVPTVYEAMLAYRAAQQTPGVREVLDRLEFRVPDGEEPNPLVTKGRPEDVEPYLLAQLARQLGDSAHVDRVKQRGADLEVYGTLGDPDAKARVEATLRSVAILRGFALDLHLSAP